MSSITNSVGGAPTFTGTAGAPAGRGSDTATHGLPDAEPAAVVPEVLGVVEDDDPVEPLLPHRVRARPAPATSATNERRKERRIPGNVAGHLDHASSPRRLPESVRPP